VLEERIFMKKEIRTNLAPLPAGPYSQGLLVGSRIYVAGQAGFNAATGKISSSVAEQTCQVLNNIKSILEAAGASMDNVVKVTAHLSDMNDFAEYNSVYKNFFNEPFPVRTTVGSNLGDVIKVEIDVIAEI